MNKLLKIIRENILIPGAEGFSVHLKTVLIILFLFQTVVISALVGYAFYRNGRITINEVSYRLHSEINARINGFLKEITNTSLKIVENNASLIGRGIIGHNDRTTIAGYFFEQIGLYRPVSSIYFGNTKGGVVNIRRGDDRDSVYIIETDGFKAGSLVTYATDKKGRRTKALGSVSGFDSTKRPWYRNAIANRGTVWNSPYILFTGRDTAVSVSSPVYSTGGRLLGVVSADMFIAQISSFLSGINHGKSGMSFIVDRYGLMIASSTGEAILAPVKEGEFRRRLHASESGNPLVRGSVEQLKEKTGNILMLDSDIHTRFYMDGKVRLMHASPFTYASGIEWVVLTVNPESDFAEAARAGNMVMLVMVFSAVIVCAAIGYFTSRCIAEPILSLNRDVMALGTGMWPVRRERSSIVEIDDLEKSFDGISGYLKQLIEGLRAEVKERKLATLALRESEEKYKALIQHSNAIILRLDTAGRITYANDYALDFFGFRAEELIGKKAVGTVIPYIDSAGSDLEDMMESLIKDPELYHKNENENIRKDGSRARILWSNREIFNDDGKYAGVMSIGTDITDRTIAERRVQKLLDEKELILREVHHRLKNNMNTIAGILFLQSETVSDEMAAAALKEAHSRILSMMLIYDRLFRSSEFSGMQTRSFFTDLISGIGSTFPGFGDIKLITEIDDCRLNSGVLIPLGIIINELLTNAYKYAFTDGREGEIKITFLELGEGRYSLVFRDNGVGLPEETGPGQSKGFGLNLIYLLAQQFGGTVKVDCDGGSAFTINFKA